MQQAFEALHNRVHSSLDDGGNRVYIQATISGDIVAVGGRPAAAILEHPAQSKAPMQMTGHSGSGNFIFIVNC